MAKALIWIWMIVCILAMRFTWDEAKRQSNMAKHGLDFADAAGVFAGPHVVAVDRRYHYDEERLVVYGLLHGVVVAIVHVETHEEIRVISMRKGTKHETKDFFKDFGPS